MGTLNITAWHCDFPTCGHVWYTAKEPLRCAKCKRKNWNKTAGTVIKPPRSRKKLAGKGTAKPEISQIDKSVPETVLVNFVEPAFVVQPLEESAAPGWEKLAAAVLPTIVHAPVAERFQAALKHIAEPEHKIGEKCKHGWSNWLQCPKCNQKVAE